MVAGNKQVMSGKVTETEVHLRASHLPDTMPNSCIIQEWIPQPHHCENLKTYIHELVLVEYLRTQISMVTNFIPSLMDDW